MRWCGISNLFVEVESESAGKQPAKSRIKFSIFESPLSIPKMNIKELTILKFDIDLERSERLRDQKSFMKI